VNQETYLLWAAPLIMLLLGLALLLFALNKKREL